MRLAIAAAAALFAVAAAPASAQDSYWASEPLDGGCYVQIPAVIQLPEGSDFSWDGRCVAGEGVTGQGSVSLSFSPQPGAERLSAVTTGEWIAGYPHGLFSVQVRDSQGRLLSESSVIYNMGCTTDAEENSCVPGVAP